MNEQPSNSEWINPQDQEQALKQVSRLLKSPAGRQAIKRGLIETNPGREIVSAAFGVTIVDPKEEERKPIVAILIPTHKKMENETGQAIERMLPVARQNCHVVMRPIVGSSVVHWVRNDLLARLYKDKTPFDYVLFMDDDMVPQPEALSVLVERKVDIIGAVCTVRQDPPLPNVRHYNREAGYYQVADIDRPGLWEVDAIGTGFLLISKKALDAIGEYTLSQRYWIEHYGLSVEEAAKREKIERERAAQDHNCYWFEFLRHGPGEISEDVSFCFKAQECGFKIFADSSIQVGHVGSYAFSLGDYWAYREEAIRDGKVVPLKGLQPEVREEQAIQVIEG